MFNKLVSSSTTSYHTKNRTISIELVEPVDSEEMELLSISFFQMMLNLSGKSRIITTHRLKRYHKTLKISTLEQSEEPSQPNIARLKELPIIQTEYVSLIKLSKHLVYYFGISLQNKNQVA
jgi:hypothetical protein